VSWERIWRWTCDGCGLVEERHHSGFPSGWIFVKAKKLTHRCSACAADVPTKQQGKPKVVADM
jgi:hypothetical protein